MAGSSMVNVTKGSPGQGQVVLPNSLMVDHIFYFLSLCQGQVVLFTYLIICHFFPFHVLNGLERSDDDMMYYVHAQCIWLYHYKYTIKTW